MMMRDPDFSSQAGDDDAEDQGCDLGDYRAVLTLSNFAYNIRLQDFPEVWC